MSEMTGTPYWVRKSEVPSCDLQLLASWLNSRTTNPSAYGRADSQWHPRVRRGIEFNFQKVARIEQDACVERHATLAHLGATAFDDSGRKALRRDDPNG